MYAATMGFARRVWQWLSTAPDATFSESDPRPIDRVILEMSGRGSATRVGRIEALSVPAVLRARNLICSISTLPLIQVGPDRQTVRNALLEQIDPDVPNVVTLAQTLEDLLFEGSSWWRITGFGFDGFPMTARHLDFSEVSLQPPPGRVPAPLPGGYDPREAMVWVDGEPVPAREMIRFDSPNPGVLQVGGRAIRRAILLDQAAAMYADDPRPQDYFSPAEGADPADDDDIRDTLTNWKRARKERSTAYVPAALKYNSVDSPSPADLQLVALQQRASLDIANSLGLDPEELGISTTSRTYANVTDRRRDKINDTLSPYMAAITERLSMGDVTKRGYLVAFNLDDYLRADPITRVAFYKGLKELGVIDAAAIAEEEGLPAPPVTGAPTPAPAPVPVGASQKAALTFDGAGVTLTADVPVQTFSVDASARTITGLALPYGEVANKGGMKFRFEPGSLQFSDLGRVKLLRDHDFRQALGRAVELKETRAGLQVKFSVARGTAGDEALALAEDGVLDGLSVGVDFDMAADTVPDSRNKGVTLVRRADLREVSLTPMPSFDSARVTKVAASRNEGETVPETTTEPTTAPAGPAVVPATAQTFDAATVLQLLTAAQSAGNGNVGIQQPEPEQRQVVNPVRVTASVTEALPYRFDRAGRFIASDAEFSTDLRDMALAKDQHGDTEAGKRVMGLLAATFATATTDVNELNPTVNRPDMYVDQRDFRTPAWDLINKGAPPNGVQPFMFPKFSSSTGLVGDHTEGTEPTAGTFVTTSQTVTPTAVSGKAELNREVFDMGGNPAVSTLVYNQMVRGYREGLESATATFLNTLTAATDVALTTAAADEALAADWDAALAELQFTRGYDFSAFVIEKVLYKAFVAARDTAGRVLYPILAPQNANGTAQTRFRTLDLGGVTGIPSWALASTAGSANNSWLFDPMTVHGWATAPQRLEFAHQVKSVDIAIWGYKAHANSDIGGVRQVTYDSVA